MVISKRERYIAIAAGVVLGVLALDSLIYTPLSDRTTAIEQQLDETNLRLGEASTLFKRSEKLNREWASFAGRAVTHSASEAESQVLNGMRQWAQDAGLNLTQVKPDRIEKLKDFHVTSFRATAGGTMSQIGRFLYAIESSSIPIRITDVSLTSRKEGADDLTLQLTVTTLYLPTETVSAEGVEREGGRS